MHEGLGKVLWFGANSQEVIDRLHWIATALEPVLKAGLAKLGPVEMKPLIAQALHMGDGRQRSFLPELVHGNLQCSMPLTV